MAKISKRMQAIAEKIDCNKIYAVGEAIELLKQCATAKFKENMEVSVNLGVDPRKSDQAVRAATVLPHGTGREVKVAVFAQNEQATAAEKAGADKVGFEDLAEAVAKGEIDYDVFIATPMAMKIVGKLGQVLGPRGLMPNPKVGTVTDDVATAVDNAKKGQVRYRTDKGGIIHSVIGKVDFNEAQLTENLQALMTDLKKVKPSTAKGIYLKKITLSTTMGPGLCVDQSSLEANN